MTEIKLSEAQEYVLSYIVAYGAIDYLSYQVIAKSPKTMQKLEEKGLINFYPYSKLSWSKSGVWKASKEGEQYALSHKLVETQAIS